VPVRHAFLSIGLKRRTRRKTAYHQYQKFYSFCIPYVARSAVVSLSQWVCATSNTFILLVDLATVGGRPYVQSKGFMYCFAMTGIASIHNKHIWRVENPYAILSHHHRRQFSISLWARILDYCPIGPRVLPSQICGRDFLDFPWTHF
jgi:hypothetical protein